MGTAGDDMFMARNWLTPSYPSEMQSKTSDGVLSRSLVNPTESASEGRIDGVTQQNLGGSK